MEQKKIFVIMPFTETPQRNQADLNSFYYDNIKNCIESNQKLVNKYKVIRSEDNFDITTQIIFDLYDSDIVICDLSGIQANPNVMYELGVRLSLSNGPVILIREENPTNRRIFDISGFHSFDYKITQYKKVEDYLVSKILKFESGAEIFQSPVLKTLKRHPFVTIELSNRDVNSRLIALHKEITFLKKRFTDALWVFLKNRLTKEEWIKIRDKKDNTEIMKELGEQIVKFEWTNFPFKVNHLPCISHFISAYPLLDVIDNGLENDFSTFVTDFYCVYLLADSYWLNFSWKRMIKFTYDCDFLIELILMVVGIINPENQHQKEKFTEFMRNKLTSYLKARENVV